MITKKKLTILLTVFVLALSHQPRVAAQYLTTYIDSLMVATKGCAYAGPSPTFMRFSMAKENSLRQIKAHAFELLQKHLADPTYSYTDNDVFLRVGNLFEPNRPQALLIYLSDALQNSHNDYRVNIHLFDLDAQHRATEIYFAKQVSAYYENVGGALGDFDLDGKTDLLVHTSEPEWYHNDRPVNEYYHLYHYQAGQLVELANFYNYPNPTFISPNLFYTFVTCGCDGDCWSSVLYQQTATATDQIGLLENPCIGIVKGYKINDTKRQQVAESLIDKGVNTAKSFWQGFVQRYIN